MAMEIKLKWVDPVRRQPARESGAGIVLSPHGFSPMDPPDAYAPPGMERVTTGEMHLFLRRYVDEHVPFLEEVNAFEDALSAIQKTGYTRELDARLRHSFSFFDREFIPHHRREEAGLFPLLHARLIASGEHGRGEASATTAIDVMMDEHTKAIQLAAVILNFLGLAFRFPDEKTRLIVLDAALEQGRNLVELLRLHIFREDNVVFSQAHRLISGGEFDELQSSQR